jgi:hypothetical protein
MVEAQSTWSANITYRCLEYLLSEWKQHLSETEQNIYQKKAVSLPFPELYVLYTGEEPHEESHLTLSGELFPGQDIPVEAVVTVLYGGEQGDILDQYVRYTKILRKNIKENGYDVSTAEKVVRECISQNILTEYMTERGAEVMAAMLDIFDQEKVWEMALKAERREGREEGLEKGMEKEAASIIRICRARMHLQDPEVILTLMEEMDLSRDKAVQYLTEYDHPDSKDDK